MIVNILKITFSTIIVLLMSLLIKHFYNKIKIKDIYKKTIIGVLFGITSIVCSLLSAKTNNGNYISLNYSAVLIGGLMFGGPVGIISGLFSAIERFFAVYYGALAETRIALSITLSFSGILSTLLNSLAKEDKKFKWYYTIIMYLVCESFGSLLTFLTNMNDLSLAYGIVRNSSILNIIINIPCIIIICLSNLFIFKEISFKRDKTKSIHSKVQINLGLSMIVGLIAVISIASVVLDNISKESVKSTIDMSLKDTIDNVKSDIDSEIVTRFKKFSNNLKQFAIHITADASSLESTATLNGFSNATIFNKDGSIFLSTDSHINSLDNISDFELKFEPIGEDETIQYGYQYIEGKNGYFEYICQRYSKSKDDLYLIGEVGEVIYQGMIEESLEKGIASRHLGEEGIILVANSINTVLSSPISLEDNSVDVSNIKANELSVSMLNGVENYSYLVSYAGYKFVGLMNKEANDLNKNISIYITSYTALLVFFILYLIIYYSIKGSVIKPLVRVNNSLDKICEGNLDEKVNEISSKELKSLSEDINQTVDSLKEYMGKEAKMIRKELSFAKQIQYSALPSTFPPFPSYKEFELYASMNAAKEVGGDFYDFYLVDDRHLCILIADVSGKGVPAALFMMQSKSIIKSYMESKIPLEQAINQANKKICETNSANMFVTVWCGVIDLDSGILEYVNAGHNQPLIKNGTNEFKFLECKAGFVFGVMDMINYKSQKIQLEKGSLIYLYTDGVTEATNTNLELFGNDRMLNSANDNIYADVSEFCNNMTKCINDFTDGAEQSDDITQLYFKYNG